MILKDLSSELFLAAHASKPPLTSLSERTDRGNDAECETLVPRYR